MTKHIMSFNESKNMNMRYFRIICGDDDKGIICTNSEQKDDHIIEKCIRTFYKEMDDNGYYCFASDIVEELNRLYPIYEAKSLLYDVIDVEY